MNSSPVFLQPNHRWFKIKLKDSTGKIVDFYFRGVTSNELRVAGTKEDLFASESYILSCCVLSNEDWETTAFVGTAKILLNEIYKISGLTDEDLPMKEAARWISDERGSAEAVAITMIPSLDLQTLQNCNQFDYAKYLLVGKLMFESLYNIPVEQAFVTKSQPQTPPIPNIRSEAPPMPGQVATSQELFTFKKG